MKYTKLKLLSSEMDQAKSGLIRKVLISTLCPHCPANWAGSRARSPACLLVYVSGWPLVGYNTGQETHELIKKQDWLDPEFLLDVLLEN